MTGHNQAANVAEYHANMALEQIEEYEPARLVTMFRGLAFKISQTEFPRVEVVISPSRTRLTTGAAELDQDEVRFKCPHCNHPDITVEVVRWSLQSTPSDPVVDEFGEFRRATFQQDTESPHLREPLYYACGNCAEPVRLPLNWEGRVL